MLTIKIIFWTVFFTLFYIYFGYPLFVFLLSMIFNRKVQRGDCVPAITILIAAYNEEDSIAATIENKLSLDYPGNKREIIVISDGSTDKTDEIVRSFNNRGVKLIRQEPRNGKTSALNMAVPRTHGEILVFSDANSIYDHEALRYLLMNFRDPDVGYVTGKMVYTNPEGSIVGDGCSAYMKYENFLRKHEMAMGSIVGVDGGIDAVRKCIYKPMRSDQLPDFVLPLRVAEQGYRVVYEPRAILKEQALSSSHEEFEMRVRVSLRTLWALRDMIHLFNLFKYGIFSWQLFSHKLLRYTAFIFMLLLYILNVFLINDSIFFKYFFLGQNIFYLLSLISHFVGEKCRNVKLLYMIYFFCLVNVAATYAFLKFLNNKKQILWVPRKG